MDSGDTVVNAEEHKKGEIIMYYNEGYMIHSKHSDNKRAFSIWQGMLRRCYDIKHINYKHYGGKGVHVCDRWKCFDYFLEDIDKVEGWDSELFKNGEIILDKDGKNNTLDKFKKSYSLGNCQWITKEENLKIRNNSIANRKYFKAISPSGQEFISYNQREFCKKHNLTPSLVSRVLKCERKTHKNWKFKYL